MSNLLYTDGAARETLVPGLRRHLNGEQQKRNYRRIPAYYQQPDGAAGCNIRAEALTKTNLSITVYPDSQYVVKAVTQGWLNNWYVPILKRRKYDLWKGFSPFQKNSIQFVWVKVMRITRTINRCDVLATTAADGKIYWWMKNMKAGSSVKK